MMLASSLLACASLKISEGDSQTPETNLQIIQKILGNLAEQVLNEATLPADAVVGLKVRQSLESWVTENALSERIAAHRYKVMYVRDSDSVAAFIFTVGDAGAKVKYSNTHRISLFGRKHTERLISVHIQSQVYNSQSGNILSGKMLTSEYKDTVFTDDISSLENADIPMTKAELPDESFIDRIIEPIIIVGTAGIAVFLFFHIRS
jgi:hypothetical protein